MNVAIVGATGYGGIQAVNLLKKNKKYKISFLGGNKTSGLKWNDNFPFIYLDADPYIEKISADKSITLSPRSNNFLVNVEDRPFGKQSNAKSAFFEMLSTEISSI